jgi:hypothetical protein
LSASKANIDQLRVYSVLTTRYEFTLHRFQAGTPPFRARQAGIWMSRAERRRIQQPRHPRKHIGELVQIDGSEHRWFEDRAAACTLLVFIDGATSRLMELRFVPSESTSAYFEALRAYLRRHGKPIAFYSDKHSIFRVSIEPPAWSLYLTRGEVVSRSLLEHMSFVTSTRFASALCDQKGNCRAREIPRDICKSWRRG